MSHSIYHNSKNDRQYRAATGISRQEFEALFVVFAPHYTPKMANPHPGSSQPVLTDKREALFFILHYLKAYPTLQNLGLYFGMSDSAASHYLERLKPCLKAALARESLAVSRLFEGQEAFDAVFKNVDVLFLDVTEIPIERAADQAVQREHYSGKKNSTP